MTVHTRQEIEGVQRALNSFLKDRTLGYPALKVDGRAGNATDARIKDAKFLLGYTESRVDSSFGDELMWRLHNPSKTHAKSKVAPFTVDKSAIQRGKSRRTARRKAVVRNHAKAIITTGVTYYDGVPVAKAAVFYLDYARHTGVDGRKWGGRLSSGWRDPVYSRGICIQKCGAPSCPGICAGLSSNHVGQKLVLNGPGSQFALDVTDYIDFGHIMSHMPAEALEGRPRLSNHLPADPVHYSPTGN